MFNVCSTEIWSVVISISSIIYVYSVTSNKGGVKIIRKEIIMIGVHKTRNKKRINVKSVKEIMIVKKGCSMGKIFSSTNDSDDAFL